MTVVWRRKGTILGVVVAVAAATFGISNLLPATYEATATVRVAAQSGSTSQQAVLASNDLASQYAQLASSAPVLRSSEVVLGLPAGALDGVATGATVGEQNLIDVTVTASDARQAGIRADTVARTLVTQLERANREQARTYVQRVNSQLAPLDRRIRLARAEIETLSRQVAAGGTVASAAATIIAARQSDLSSLEGRRDSVVSNVAQVSAVQPTLSLWSDAGSGYRTEPKPVLYTIVVSIVAALVMAQLVVVIANLRERRSS